MKYSGWLYACCLLLGVLSFAVSCGRKQPDVAHGEELFNAHCWNCHDKKTVELSSEPGQGPGMKDYVRRSPHQAMDGTSHEHSDEFISNFIRNGSKNMPPQGHYLSPEDVGDLVAYIKTL
jgi:mono/diheme cytochrome c family protein